MAKTGVDDYLVAGGTVAELLLMARPFEPQDVARERLSRDETLRRAIEDLWTAHDAMPQARNAECTDRATMRDFIRTAERRGKVGRDGVQVRRSAREGSLASEASLGGWIKSVGRLEDGGRIRRVQEPNRRREQAITYVLLTPGGEGRAVREQYGKGGTLKEKETQGEQRVSSLSKATYDRGVHAARAPSDDVPELRWPKVILYWERRDGKRVVADSHYVARLGKRRREIIAHLAKASSGSCSVAELMELFASPRARKRDFRSRTLGPLEADGIINVVSDFDVSLSPSWRDALEEARERCDEIKDARLQAERYERQGESFRNRDKTPADPEPELRGKEHTGEVLERNRPEWEREDARKRRRMVEPAVAFVSDTLRGLEHIRLALLEDIWQDAGGQSYHLRLALRELRCKVRGHAEHPGELFVYAPPQMKPAKPAPERTEPAPVVELYPEPVAEPVAEPATVRALPEKVDGVYVHEPECSCWICDSPASLAPRCATPWSAS